MTKPTVFVFAGLPGVGKSTICAAFARLSGLYHLRVDAIEGPFLEGKLDVDGMGYAAMRNLASVNREHGLGCIVDRVSPSQITREMFVFLPPTMTNVEDTCSSEQAHPSIIITNDENTLLTELNSLSVSFSN
jgi:adenylate kinase family enzyme